MIALLTRLGMAAVIGTLAACGGTGVKTFHDYNPSMDFSSYQTFSFISDHPMVVSSAAGAVNPLLEGRVMKAISMDLSRKGFREVSNPEQADVAISFTVGSREQIKVDQYPASYRTGYSRYYGRGYGYGMGYGTETRVRQYTEGQLAVDIFDVKTHNPAFHGTATKRITSGDREDPVETIALIVGEALDGFPPGSGSGVAKPGLVPPPDPS